jgi:biotin carboxyl carrier protein
VPKYQVTIQGKTYQVEIPDPGASPLEVIVDGQTFEVGIADQEARALPTAAGASMDAGPAIQRRTPATRPTSPARGEGERVTAPMPGTILSVDVEHGQEVDGGQVVCVLEAMKMKNPVRAARAGTVVRVLAQVGQSVAYGDLLVELG